MKFIINVDNNDFESFVLNHPTKSHFMQSSYFGEISESKHFIPHYVGVKQDNILIAAALVLEKKHKSKFSYLYIPRGYVMDFNNLEVLTTMTNGIKEFAKSKNAFFVKIDPDIKLHDLDSDGKILGNDNYKIVEDLKSLGYKQKKLNMNFESNQPRYTFRLDITPGIGEIKNNFHLTTRKILAKGMPSYLSVYKSNDYDDYESFYKTMQQTSERESINIMPLEYYRTFHQVFNKHNMSDLYVLKVNIPDLIEYYNQTLINIEHNLLELTYTKNRNIEKTENLKKDLLNQKNKMLREFKKVKEINSKEIVLSSIITTKYKDKVWLVHGGNLNILRELNANYFLYYKIIEDAKNEGYLIVDFFGTTGDVNSHVAGIHLFKKRFGGEYMEFIGEFDLVINKLLYFIYINVLPRIKKK
jgi:peptidoglycan pentaglycine glycine transferase (the first glycine)